MRLLATISAGVVGLINVWIMALEMVFWTQPLGQSVFDLTPEFAAEAAVRAVNQGLYNGCLAAGLFWGLFAGPGGRGLRRHGIAAAQYFADCRGGRADVFGTALQF